MAQPSDKGNVTISIPPEALMTLLHKVTSDHDEGESEDMAEMMNQSQPSTVAGAPTKPKTMAGG